jgi:HPt (histidine-containing phosphotransfer) domain-containing protein
LCFGAAGQENLVELLRILIVGELDPENSSLNEMRKAGHRILVAAEQDEAVEILDLQRFDAVFLPQSCSPQAVQTIRSKVEGLPGEHPRLLTLPDGGLDQIHRAMQEGGANSATAGINLLARFVGTSGPVVEAEGSAVDVAELRSQVANDDDLLGELIDLFLSEQALQSAELKQAVLDDDFRKTSRVAHTIKGSLASLHAKKARLLAQALEQAAQQENPEQCHDILPQFEQSLDRVSEQLSSLRRSLSVT